MNRHTGIRKSNEMKKASNLYSPKNEKCVNQFLKELESMGLAEKECGVPIKVNVHWDSGEVWVMGPKQSRVLNIADILKS